MTFTSVADHLTRPAREIPEPYREAVEDVLDAAAEWARGDLPWTVAAGIGAVDLETPAGPIRRGSPYTRALAIHLTDRSDPRWRVLHEFCTHIVTMTGYTITSFGVFDAYELHQHDASARYVREHDAPWERKDAA